MSSQVTPQVFSSPGQNNWLLRAIVGALLGGNGVSVFAQNYPGFPAATKRTFDYIGSTNNVSHVYYKKTDDTLIATVTYTYVAAGAADNDKVASETIEFA